MVCNSRCHLAKSEPDKCKCSCQGVNHGHKKETYEKDMGDYINITLTPQEVQPLKAQMNKRFECFCGYKGLHNLPIYGYKHEGGWDVRDGKYWLWVHCPKCNNDWSIWKLGASRNMPQKDITTYTEVRDNG